MADPPPEIELKFRLAPADVEALWRATPRAPTRRVRMSATYYDTPELELRSAGFSLRVRDEAGRRVQTAKSTGGEAGVFARAEWERELASGAALDHEMLAATPLKKVLKWGGAERLQPLFTVDVVRRSKTVAVQGSVVEIALDRGWIRAGRRRRRVLELELELKAGETAAVLALARSLSVERPLRLVFETKSDQGYRLAAGKDRAPRKADSLALSRKAGVADALQAIGRAALSQITANAELMLEKPSPGALHQLRIGVRRLRSALSTFKGVAADDRFALVGAELRWLGGELNPARDLDVLVGETFDLPLAPGDADGAEALGGALLAAQRAARARAAEAIVSQRYRDLVLETAAWLETGDWTAGAAAAEPARDFAADALSRRWRKVKKRGRHLAAMNPEARHEVRIEAKKLRYAAEFLGDLFGAAKRKAKFFKALKALQEALGGLNDLAVGREVMAAVVGPAPDPSAAVAAEHILRAREAQTDVLLHAAEKAHARLVEVDPFWKSAKT